MTPLQELRRSVCACLLWEETFYEGGEDVAGRIGGLVGKVEPSDVYNLALEARTTFKLRHVPLWLAVALVKHGQASRKHRQWVSATIANVVQRADEPAELLALYWKDGKKPITRQMKRGLGLAVRKFNAYQVAKYKGQKGTITFKDVLALTHPRPRPNLCGGQRGQELREQASKGKVAEALRAAGASPQEILWAQVFDGTLPTPDTWEVALTAAGDDREAKRAAWERLLDEGKLGALALLRNLRNMEQAGVNPEKIRIGLLGIDTERVLPFRFLAAVRHAPRYAEELEAAMLKSVANLPKLPGETILLVDVSGSMEDPLSERSEMQRMDAATGLAVVLRETCEHLRVFSFSNGTVEVPPYRGLALAKAITDSQPHQGTNLGSAVAEANQQTYSRVIVLTDEQSHTRVGGPKGRGYTVNVASNQRGVGYGPWTHIDGFSEGIVAYLMEQEAAWLNM